MWCKKETTLCCAHPVTAILKVIAKASPWEVLFQIGCLVAFPCLLEGNAGTAHFGDGGFAFACSMDAALRGAGALAAAARSSALVPR